MNSARKTKITHDAAIVKFTNIHGTKFNYDKVIYEGTSKPVIVVCSDHGEFKIRPGDHWRGGGCKKCFISRSIISQEAWILRFKEVHNNLYDYSKSVVTGNASKIIIICKVHGEFKQNVHNHWRGHGCQKCARIVVGDKSRRDKEYFIDKAQILHKNRYTYECTTDESVQNSQLIITCDIHGQFTKNIWNHLTNKQGCPKCNNYGRYNENWFHNNPDQQILPSTLYLLKFSNEHELFYKIGITKRDIGTRWKGQKTKDYNIDIMFAYSSTLYESFQIEQSILQNYIYKNRYHPKNKIGGDYECFKDEDLYKTVLGILLKL